MAILHKQKYKCSTCSNTFITTEGCIPATNLKCQECGGNLVSEEMSTLDHINPLEKIKSVKHTVKSIFGLGKKAKSIVLK